MQNDPMQNYTPPTAQPFYTAAPARIDLKTPFRSTLFFVMCILMTVSVVAGLLGSFDIFAILACIGMWITYSAAANQSSEELEASGLTLVSGSLLAQKVLLWISFGFLALISILLIVAGALFPAGMTFGNSLEPLPEPAFGVNMSLSDMLAAMQDPTTFLAEPYNELLRLLYDVPIGIFLIGMGVGFIFATVFLLIYILVCFRFLRGFAKSLTQYAKGEINQLRYASAASIWLLIIGICNVIATIGSITMLNLFQIPAAILSTVVYILGFVFIKKYFVEQ